MYTHLYPEQGRADVSFNGDIEPEKAMTPLSEDPGYLFFLTAVPCFQRLPMIRQYREKNADKPCPHVPREISALEWNAHRPYSSLSILCNWAAHLANSCYLDGLERGKEATGVLVFRASGGLISVKDGDFVTREEGALCRHEKKKFLEEWQVLPELTTEERVAL